MAVKRRLVYALDKEFRTTYNYVLRTEERSLLEGKKIIVTGATGAIGFATCLKLGSEGAIVGVAGRSEEKVRATIEKLESINSNAKYIPVLIDVTDEKQIETSINAFAEAVKGIDGIVNNAGGGERKRKAELWDLPTDVIDEVLDTNLRGAMLCSKYALKHMISLQQGSIINLSSVMGLNGKEKMTSYSASKAGIIGFTKALALECGPHNIRVNAIAPGMIYQYQLDRCPRENQYTRTNALRRYGFTDEAASLIAFLLSDEAAYITGQTIAVDGGRSIGLMDNK